MIFAVNGTPWGVPFTATGCLVDPHEDNHDHVKRERFDQSHTEYQREADKRECGGVARYTLARSVHGAAHAECAESRCECHRETRGNRNPNVSASAAAGCGAL